jgi:tetratricopeptide (TPR) repeat protein
MTRELFAQGMRKKFEPLGSNGVARNLSLAVDEVNRLVALFNAGAYAELESQARSLIRQYPNAGFVWKVLGVALKSQGKDALVALKKATELLPNDAEAHSNLALALQDLGQLEAAVASCKRALMINPNFAAAHNNLSNALRELRHLDAAAQSCRRALEINPNFAEAHHGLGAALRNQGRTAEAEVSCRRALEINPDLPGAITFMAELQADKGHFADAEALFRRAIALNPESPEAWAGIAGIRKMTTDNKDWLSAAQAIAGRVLPPRSEARLRYAIGKYHDDVSDFEQAFANYRRANELGKLYGTKYERKQQTLVVDLLSRAYDRNWVCREQADANPSARPVFIIGMPRSGTSLAEQILASHPAVFGGGELGFWKNASTINTKLVLKGKIDKGALAQLATDYLKLLQGISADASRVIDKMPDNFMHLGLIYSAFPNARIIHMQRNPIDTCLSIYFQHFNTSHAYANDLDDLAHYYTEYFRMMEHWRATLPEDAILHVPYEELVGDHEGWSRKMLDFIGLPWDSRCLDFHQCRRTVSTASNWQVRQKISKSSVLRWLNYEKFVDPLQKLMQLDRPAGHEPHREQQRAGDGTIPLLGNIQPRTEPSRLYSGQDAQSPLFQPQNLRPGRTSKRAIAVR